MRQAAVLKPKMVLRKEATTLRTDNIPAVSQVPCDP